MQLNIRYIDLDLILDTLAGVTWSALLFYSDLQLFTSYYNTIVTNMLHIAHKLVCGIPMYVDRLTVLLIGSCYIVTFVVRDQQRARSLASFDEL